VRKFFRNLFNRLNKKEPMTIKNGWESAYRLKDYQPKTFLGNLAKSLGYNVEDPRASLMSKLGDLYQEAYRCRTEEQRLGNIRKQELIKALLRELEE